MKQLSMLLIVVCLGCSYTRTDIKPIALMTAGAIADAYATDREIRDGGIELNDTVYGSKPSGEMIAIVGAIKIAIILIAGEWIPEKWHDLRRKLFCAIGAVSISVAVTK